MIPPPRWTRFQSSRRRNWFRWQVAWAQSARELSENYTLTGQSELPTTILSTDPIQQNHSNLKGNRLLVGGTKGLIRNSFLCPLYRRNGLAPGIGKRKYEKSRVHHARSSLCRDCKVSRGKLEPPTVSILANYLLGNTSMKAYRAKSFYFVVELSFLSFFLPFYRSVRKERMTPLKFESLSWIDTTLPFSKVCTPTEACVFSNFLENEK